MSFFVVFCLKKSRNTKHYIVFWYFANLGFHPNIEIQKTYSVFFGILAKLMVILGFGQRIPNALEKPKKTKQGSDTKRSPSRIVFLVFGSCACF